LQNFSFARVTLDLTGSFLSRFTGKVQGFNYSALSVTGRNFKKKFDKIEVYLIK
jgi:hypothetical protein